MSCDTTTRRHTAVDTPTEQHLKLKLSEIITLKRRSYFTKAHRMSYEDQPANVVWRNGYLLWETY
jgi:hypothetical protein